MRLNKWLPGHHGAGDDIADSNVAGLNDPFASDFVTPFTIFDPQSSQAHSSEAHPSTLPQSSSAAGAIEVHDTPDASHGLLPDAQAFVVDGGGAGSDHPGAADVTDQSGSFQLVYSGAVEDGSVTVTDVALESYAALIVQTDAATTTSDQPLVPVDPAPNSEVTVVHNTTTASNNFGAVFGVAYLTGGNTVLVGATPPGSNDSSAGGNPVDTGLQVAIVNGSNVSFVDMPLPGGSVSTDYVGGASVTALTNGNFAVLYWGSNASNGGEGAQNNDNLPDYYVQIFTPDGTQVGGLITLDAAASNNFNGYGWIAEDPANNGFVVSTATNDEVDVVVQRFSNTGTAGASFSITGGYGFAYVDSAGDIVETYEDRSLNSKYAFIPAGATSLASSGVLLDQPMPGSSYLNFTAAASGGGFVAFYFSGTNLMAQTLSATGALGSPITVANVGSVATGNMPWSVVTLSNGNYAITLVSQSNSGYTEYPGTNKVIEVGPSLTSADTTVYDLTTSGGSSSVQLGPYAVAGPSGSLISYNETAGNGVSNHDVPLEATVTAVSYLGSTGPTVTAANIHVSGGSGTGSAFKIGDTVTATWNNSASGDNNTDPINGVTFDFSQFGGGSAVHATNSGGVWTATYVVTAGSIDTANAHVAVTATDTSSNATTTSGSAVTVDDVQPVITAAHISISGGTGTGGAFKIGDTVTVSWDNSASGDHNTDTINAGGVTADFTEFGGGVVHATNSGGIWTATYTITAGTVDQSGVHVNVDVLDHVGNSSTQSSGPVTVDNEQPVVTPAHISVSGGTGTGGAFKIGDTVTATWDGGAGGDNNTDTISFGGVTFDFSQFGGGSAVIATDQGGGVWNATYTITAGAIDTANAHVGVTAADHVGNATTAASSTVTVDNEQPVVTTANITTGGGPFGVGYSVTAIWDNSAAGDNNTDTISAVTFDFSQFGGPSAVAGSNLGHGDWIAGYTIAIGSIDTANAHVVVTVTDHVGNATTASGSAVTVDDMIPQVHAANIHASGGTGTGGAFKIGDTVTVSWDNSASGDHNTDTINAGGVTFDLSQFGGGTAVVATNNGGIWTASYTITAGNIDIAPAHVGVTVTDHVGNATTTSAVTVDVDNEQPVVTTANIHLSGASGAGGAFKIGDTVTATWDDSGTGDHNTDTINAGGVTFDFTQFGGGSVVATDNAGVWTATYIIAAGNIDTASAQVGVTVIDHVGNTGSASSSAATVDNEQPGAPTLALHQDTGVLSTDHVTSNPLIDYTKANPADTLLYKLDGAAGFTTVVPVITTDGVHTVSVEEQDAAGNVSAASSLTFTLDTTAPTVTVSADHPVLAPGQTATVTFDFSEAVAGFSLSDVQLGGGALSDFQHVGLNGGHDIYTATFTPQVAVNLSDALSVAAAGYTDIAGNYGAASNTVTFTGDTNSPGAPHLALQWDSGTSATDGVTRDPVIDYFKSNPADTLLFKVDNATSFSSTMPSFATDGSQDGAHTVSVEEADAGGNLSAVASLSFTLDTTAPHITEFGASVSNGSVMAGSTVQFTIGFNEGVSVAGGTPELTLNDGGTAVYDAVATMAKGDTSKLVFDYVVSATDQTSALTVTGFASNGAVVNDAAGNHPDLSAVTQVFNLLEINETSTPAYSVGALERPELHFDSTGHILLDAAATTFADQYGIQALYLGLPPGTPYPPVAELHA
ncbi:hypothetical protein IC762_03495 [Bradyrhizobium genosp. L]|uniref:beta strand repeat-containing protein n=1 Tax=Bradyrhizobium genosp. L TaxID=83637 RepID=UPI0018A32ED1|nr:Ig-like domain-containing protein [Bradyrhizobium genosp. L]QPF85409.1 hypothetical protein IC762_03495 [Bradyrhizobium genosp. L]